jgi:O-antigen ligase
MNRQRVDEICGQAILLVVLAILAFGPLMMGATRGEDIALIGLLTSLTAGIWLIRIWIKPEQSIAWPQIAFAVLAFVVYALFRYPSAPVEYAARMEIFRILVYALFFFVVLNNTSHRALSRVSHLVVLVGVFMSFYAIYQFMTRSDMVWNLVRPAQYVGRGSGTYICPNHLAGYLELAIPLGLSQLFMGRLGHTGRMLLGYAVLTMVAGLGSTVSRGGWLATAVGLLGFFAVFIFSRGRRIPAILLLGVILLAGIGFISTTNLAQRRIEMATAKTSGDDARVHIWRAANEIWSTAPWIGIGPGQFDSQFRAHRPPLLQARAVYVHNDYLNTLVDWGVLGFVIVAAFFAGFAYSGLRIWKHVRRDKDDLASMADNRSSFVLATAIGTASLLVHSFVDFNFQIPANAILVFALIGLTCGIGHVSRQIPSLKPGKLGRFTLTLIVLLTCGWLVPESTVKLREGLRQTQSLYPDLPASDELCLLREMHRIDPMNPDTSYRLGEMVRQLNWEKPPGYYGNILEAIEHFETAIRLDPHNAYSFIRLGMCQDLLRDYRSASETFQHALKLDPNGAFTAASVGWHHLQIDEYEQARNQLQRSLSLNWWDNDFAREQLEIVSMFLPEDPAAAK